MEEKLREYVNGLFASVPGSERAFSVKSETLGKLMLIYQSYIAEGKGENEAYALAVSSLGDVGIILDKARAIEIDEPIEAKKRSGIFIAAAVALYILCPIPVILLQNEVGVVLLLLFVAIATGLLIFNAVTRKRSLLQAVDNTFSKENNSVFKAVSSALWSLIVVIYFVLSFTTNAWHITWVVFLIGAAIEGILKAVFELKESKK